LLPIRFTLLLSLLGFSLVGCGSDGPKKNGVRGQVTWKTQPLANGTIDFTPLEATGGESFGGTIENGQYEIERSVGLPAGKYKVSIQATNGPPENPSGDDPNWKPKPIIVIPPTFNFATTLTAEVTDGGPNQFDFHLKPGP
jgi:hypothetical protein